MSTFFLDYFQASLLSHLNCFFVVLLILMEDHNNGQFSLDSGGSNVLKYNPSQTENDFWRISPKSISIIFHISLIQRDFHPRSENLWPERLDRCQHLELVQLNLKKKTHPKALFQPELLNSSSNSIVSKLLQRMWSF